MAELAATVETMSSSDTELLLEAQQPRRASRMRTFTLVAGLVAACALVSLWHNPSVMSKVRHGLFLGLSEESEDADEDAGRDASCTGLPYVKLEAVVSSNIGKKGPDTSAEEGIIYNATAHHLDHLNISHLQIHVHTLEQFNESEKKHLHHAVSLMMDKHDDTYEPAFTHGEYVNGINGRFGIISVKPGKKLKVRFHAYDADKKKDVPLPHGSISFFDLDGGKVDENGTLHSKEHVTVCEYSDYYLTNSTEITTTTDGDCATFTASESGNGDDNPDDPLNLTPLQKDRAVTLAFKDKSKFEVEIGATAGELSRVFSFTFRPSLLCAATKLDDGQTIAASDEKSPKVVKHERERSAADVMKLPPVILVLGLASYLI